MWSFETKCRHDADAGVLVVDLDNDCSIHYREAWGIDDVFPLPFAYMARRLPQINADRAVA